ncbi:MAG: polyprenyl synthetase family protein [Candidatus Bathyarchaeia archaeon]
MKLGSLTRKALAIVQQKGQIALAEACQKIIQNQYDDGIVREALHFYARAVLPRVLPIFPTLIHLSSEAVGQVPENASSVAASMMLITSSGDIHDDIVDNSAKKFGRSTLFGKYGRDTALLAGDMLLIQGTKELQTACSNSASEQKKTISDLIAATMTQIVKAEAVESSLWHKPNVAPEDFFEVIRLKGCVAELHCKIGGVIGGGDEQEIGNLAGYGRTVGLLLTLKEEFVDLKSPVELEHRIKHELPPYPMLIAMKDDALNRELTAITKEIEPKKMDLPKIAEKVLGSSEIRKLRAELRDLGRKELTGNLLFRSDERTKELAVLLEALAEELAFV